MRTLTHSHISSVTLDRYIQCTCYHHPGSYHPGSCHSGSCHPGSTVTSRSINHRTHMKTSRGIYGYLIFTPGKRLHHLLSIRTVQLFGSIIVKVLGFCTFSLDCSAEPNLHGSIYLRLGSIRFCKYSAVQFYSPVVHV